MIFAVISLLFAGTSITVMQSYSDLHSSQGNLCNTSEECRQSNEGPLVQGNDNSVNGFNDQSTNTVTSAASSPETGNETKLTTTTTNLNVCEEVVDPTGSNVQPSDFTFLVFPASRVLIPTHS